MELLGTKVAEKPLCQDCRSNTTHHYAIVTLAMALDKVPDRWTLEYKRGCFSLRIHGRSNTSPCILIFSSFSLVYLISLGIYNLQTYITET